LRISGCLGEAYSIEIVISGSFEIFGVDVNVTIYCG
jgi:hypothetical protein